MVVIKDDVTTVDGLAVDWLYNHIYWTNTDLNTIEVCTSTVLYCCLQDICQLYSCQISLFEQFRYWLTIILYSIHVPKYSTHIATPKLVWYRYLLFSAMSKTFPWIAAYEGAFSVDSSMLCTLFIVWLMQMTLTSSIVYSRLQISMVTCGKHCSGLSLMNLVPLLFTLLRAGCFGLTGDRRLKLRGQGWMVLEGRWVLYCAVFFCMYWRYQELPHHQQSVILPKDNEHCSKQSFIFHEITLCILVLYSTIVEDICYVQCCLMTAYWWPTGYSVTRYQVAQCPHTGPGVTQDILGRLQIPHCLHLWLWWLQPQSEIVFSLL